MRQPPNSSSVATVPICDCESDPITFLEQMFVEMVQMDLTRFRLPSPLMNLMVVIRILAISNPDRYFPAHTRASGMQL